MTPGRREPPAALDADSAARTRETIDGGCTGDKVPGFDPAAAPLGTDAESAGTPPPAAPARVVRRQAAPLPGQAADPAGNDRAGYLVQDRLVWPAILTAFLVAAVTAIAAGFLA